MSKHLKCAQNGCASLLNLKNSADRSSRGESNASPQSLCSLPAKPKQPEWFLFLWILILGAHVVGGQP